LEITKSEIWYTYSTLYTGNLFSEDQIANIFLFSGITDSIFDGNGNHYFLDNSQLEIEKVDIELALDKSSAKFKIPKKPENNFSQEILYQNCLNSFFERMHFSLRSKFSDHNYLRFSLGKIVIENSEIRFHLFPYVNFYKGGVIIIEFRVIYDFPISLDDFINKYINLSINEFEKCYTSKELSNCSKLLKGITKDSEKIIDESSPFTFNLYEFCFHSKENKSISSILNNLFQIFEYILNGAFSETWKYRKFKVEIGQFWFGKPHIHLLEFSTQERKASQFLEKNDFDIKRMLNRFVYLEQDFKENIIVKDLRKFEDFNTIFNLGISINIWSKNGIEGNNKSDNLNNNLAVYSNQVINRFLDYYSMLHKRATYEINQTDNYEKILKIQSDFCLLKNDYLFLANSGELKELLDFARAEFELDEQEDINRAYLEIKSKEIENEKNKRINKTTLLITILFGVISSGTLAKDVIRPIWTTLNIPLLFVYSTKNDLFFWGVSFLFILVVIGIVLKKNKV